MIFDNKINYLSKLIPSQNGKILNRITFFSIICSIFFLFVFASNEQKLTDQMIASFVKTGLPGKANIEYPLNKTIFPPEIAPPTFMWKEDKKKCDTWLVFFMINDSISFKSLIADKTEWTPDKDQWEKIKKLSIGKESDFIVIGCKKNAPNKLLSGSRISFTISKDSVGAPIFFRAVTLPFSYAVDNLESISWRLGNVSSTEPATTMLKNIPVCANCHSFSNDSKTLGMDIDYANDKGSYALTDVSSEINLSEDKIITWSDYRREDKRPTYGLLSSVSPDGRYVASTVKDRSIFVSKNDEMYSQLFFPIKGIIAIYDKINKVYFPLKGADDSAFVQSNAIWSPDGKYILFAKATAFYSPEAEKSKKAILPTSVAKDFIEGRKRFNYDIYRIPFNNGEGGTPELLKGASQNDMSNYFPKYSPDGKWIVFNQAKNFMLLQPDSKLYIMPAEGGEPRLMNCNTTQMNSWHSFSPNGKWLVFSSKARGPYTKLYLTHIDENGNDSPPICLEYMIPNNLAANIPEFVNFNPNDKIKMRENFMNSDFYTEARVNDKARKGDFKGAIFDLQKAIHSDSNNYKLYLDKAIIEKTVGNDKSALDDLDKCIALNPPDDRPYMERGLILMSAEDYKNSYNDFDKAYQLAPKNLMAYFQRAVAKYYLKDYNGSLEDINTLLKLKPDAGEAYYMRALINIHFDKLETVCKDFKTAEKYGSKNAHQAIEEYCNDKPKKK